MKYLGLAIFGLIAIYIVYVGAGANTSQSGGDQTNTILSGAGTSASAIVKALQGR